MFATYDNERRRVESWLGEYMSFGQDQEGRRVFLSVDSRAIAHNPLYRAFYARSFTDLDIMLHFHLLDMLAGGEGLSIQTMTDELADRMSTFAQDDFPDESTVRIKLKEYASLGLIRMEKRGRNSLYFLQEDQMSLEDWTDALDFFSEALPLGVVGTFARRRLPDGDSRFRFKHHYILNALDSEALYTLMEAMTDGREVSFHVRDLSFAVLPLKIYIGAWSGRQYLLGWNPEANSFSFYRIDQIDHPRAGRSIPFPKEKLQALAEFQGHLWGVSTRGDGALEHLEMTVFVDEGEAFIPERMRAERRCGSVTQVDDFHWRFTADVFDAQEMLPWLRTFLGRVTEMRCSNPEVEERFWADYDALCEMYLEGGEQS